MTALELDEFEGDIRKISKQFGHVRLNELTTQALAMHLYALGYRKIAA